MEPTGLITPQPWMTAPETAAVMAAFHEAGAEARFIGGCVRDAVLGRQARDIDIATPVEPEQVLKILETANIRAIPTGIQHGTVTAVIGTQHFEITTLRIDVESYGRHAKVAFTDDWTQDAARRDFTINTMSCDEHGNIYDPYEGLEDLSKGCIRFVGDAKQRIKEDVLRLLRFFRFYAQYGKRPINGKAVLACRTLAHRLSELSGERVRGELFRILTGPNPADTVTLMRAERVLDYILPEAGEVGRLRMLAWLLERAVKWEDVDIHPVRRLAALLKPDLTQDELSALAERLKFSNRERDHLLAMCIAEPNSSHPAVILPIIRAEMSDKDLRIACRQLGKEVVMDRALLQWAGELALEARLPPSRTQLWRTLIETAHNCDIAPFPLKGRDLLDLGIAHGPEVGRLLKDIEAWWMGEDFRPDRAACLDKLTQLLKPTA